MSKVYIIFHLQIWIPPPNHHNFSHPASPSFHLFVTVIQMSRLLPLMPLVSHYAWALFILYFLFPQTSYSYHQSATALKAIFKLSIFKPSCGSDSSMSYFYSVSKNESFFRVFELRENLAILEFGALSSHSFIRTRIEIILSNFHSRRSHKQEDFGKKQCQEELGWIICEESFSKLE